MRRVKIEFDMQRNEGIFRSNVMFFSLGLVLKGEFNRERNRKESAEEKEEGERNAKYKQIQNLQFLAFFY